MKYENFKGKYKVGDLFKSEAKREDCEYNFNTNSVIELYFDDQSSSPKFKGYQEDKIAKWFVDVNDIRPLTKKELKIYRLGDVMSKDKTKTIGITIRLATINAKIAILAFLAAYVLYNTGHDVFAFLFDCVGVYCVASFWDTKTELNYPQYKIVEKELNDGTLTWIVSFKDSLLTPSIVWREFRDKEIALNNATDELQERIKTRDYNISKRVKKITFIGDGK